VTSPDTTYAIGLLPDAAIAKFLTRGMQTGQESPPLIALRKAALQPEPAEARWNAEPVRDLLDEAMHRFADRPSRADSWLAPRLHATLRMTRAEAADSRRWNFLAMITGPDYVVWRHKGSEIVPAARFSGPHYTQAFSRLWWAAELFRDGDDYRPAEFACGFQDVLNTTMRLDVIDHRPTAHTILRLLEELRNANTPDLGIRVNALSSAVNAAGSTLMYDIFAPDDTPDHDAVRDWVEESASMAPVPWDRLPDGPDDGKVSERAISTLLPLFTQLLEEAPLRKRGKHSSTEEE
jgi:hypothetical protein